MTGPPDYAALAAIHAEAFAGSAVRPWTAREIADLAAAAGAVLAIDSPDAPSAFALARVAADEAELLAIAVSPDRRRGGVGARLLRAVEERARALGAATLLLEVAEQNVAARALYSAAGYVQVGRRPGYYQRDPSGNALILRKNL